MSRNIVPRVNKGADLGTAEKNWNRVFADAVILRGNDLKMLLDSKINSDMLTTKGDLYVAADAGVITRLPAGADGHVLRSNSIVPNGLEWAQPEARQGLTNNIVVTVGNGGDFNTINAALESLVSLYYPKYISGGNYPTVTITLLPEFVMNEQVLVQSLDLSWITINGIDDETEINRSALTTNFAGGYPAFGAENNGFLPVIGQLFNMNTSGTGTYRDGISLRNNSHVTVASGCGIKNAGSSGIYATANSSANVRSANFSGAGVIGCNAAYCSTISAHYVNASGSKGDGISASEGGIVFAEEADASNAITYGFRVWHGGIIVAHGASGTLSESKNTLTVQGIIFAD